MYFHARFRDLLLCQNDRIVYPTTVLRWEIRRPIERYLEKKKFSSGSRKYCVSGVSLFTLKITLGLLLKFSSTGLYIGRVG